MDGHVSAADQARNVSEGRVLVADVDGTSVGLLRWSLSWDEVPFMHLLWVVAGWRGRGIGTTLVTAWEREHAERGHRFVLTSTSAAERAQHFYRRLGYVDSGSLLLPDGPAELLFRRSLPR